jgi:LPXTG-motif cell wall-anchored protein
MAAGTAFTVSGDAAFAEQQPSPGCTTSVTPSQFTIDIDNPPESVATWDIQTTGMPAPTVWVRVNGGAWTTAFAATTFTTGSTPFLPAYAYSPVSAVIGGTPLLDTAYSVSLAFGNAATLAAYDANEVLCTLAFTTTFTRNLPTTGTNPSPLVMFAVLLVGAGAIALVVGRRRVRRTA